MLYTDSKVRSTLLNGSEVHELIFAKCLRYWIVWSGAKAFARRLAIRYDEVSACIEI